MFERSLRLPAPGEETFFVWGPRQTGKTTISSRRTDGYMERPELLRQEPKWRLYQVLAVQPAS